jgi:TPR repeat protein
MTVLGFYLGGQGDLQSAEQWSRKAAESGDAVAMANLGYRLARRGAYAEAETWGLKAAALGIPGAMHNLGLLYEERGEVAAALTWYRRGAERGYADVQAGRGGVDPWPGESRDGGISNTILCLAELLQRTGQSDEAEHWYRRGAELGDARAAAALAAVFADRGDAAAALSWRAQAAALARANLTRNEGSLRAAYGELAIHKHSAIMAAHAADLASQGRAAEAADWSRQAAQYGYTGYYDAAGM